MVEAAPDADAESAATAAAAPTKGATAPALEVTEDGDAAPALAGAEAAPAAEAAEGDSAVAPAEGGEGAEEPAAAAAEPSPEDAAAAAAIADMAAALQNVDVSAEMLAAARAIEEPSEVEVQAAEAGVRDAKKTVVVLAEKAGKIDEASVAGFAAMDADLETTTRTAAAADDDGGTAAKEALAKVRSQPVAATPSGRAQSCAHAVVLPVVVGWSPFARRALAHVRPPLPPRSPNITQLPARWCASVSGHVNSVAGCPLSSRSVALSLSLPRRRVKLCLGSPFTPRPPSLHPIKPMYNTRLMPRTLLLRRR